MTRKLFSDNSVVRDPLEEAIRLRDAGIMKDVESALRDRRVLMAFQPIVVSGRDGEVAFWEGLIRLRDTSGRIIPAGDFVGAVEPTLIGRQMDCVALELACTELVNIPGVRLSVNLSARSIGHPAWMQILDRFLAIDPTIGERLILEITESSVISNPQQVKSFMARLHTKGISFAIDDFGAGYTSLRYLKEFTFDILKVDGIFITNVDKETDSQLLVEAIVELAHKFDMFCVGEKVERQEEADFLVAAGMDCMQGYLFDAPTLHPYWRDRPQGRYRA